MVTNDYSQIKINGVLHPCTDDDAQTKIAALQGKFDSNGKLPTSGIAASTTSSSVSGNVTVSGAVDVHFLTVTANVDSVTVNPLPAAGKAITVIFTAAEDKTVIIGHSASARVCPGAEDLELEVPAGGYAEVSFLSDGDKVFVRGI